MKPKTYPADEIVARAYEEYYKLKDRGKKDRATQKLAVLQKCPEFRGKHCCPKCGVALLQSDIDGKDEVCLVCEKYYTIDEIKEIEEKEFQKKIDMILDDWMRCNPWYPNI